METEREVGADWKTRGWKLGLKGWELWEKGVGSVRQEGGTGGKGMRTGRRGMETRRKGVRNFEKGAGAGIGQWDKMATFKRGWEADEIEEKSIQVLVILCIRKIPGGRLLTKGETMLNILGSRILSPLASPPPPCPHFKCKVNYHP